MRRDLVEKRSGRESHLKSINCMQWASSLTIFPCLNIPNKGRPWMLKESTAWWNKLISLFRLLRLSQSNGITRKEWDLLLSSCLSVSTFTNLMSVSSSAKDWNIGLTSCKRGEIVRDQRVHWDSLIRRITLCNLEDLIHLAWSTPFSVEVDYD